MLIEFEDGEGRITFDSGGVFKCPARHEDAEELAAYVGLCVEAIARAVADTPADATDEEFVEAVLHSAMGMTGGDHAEAQRLAAVAIDVVFEISDMATADEVAELHARFVKHLNEGKTEEVANA